MLACAFRREWREPGLKKRSRVDLGGSPMPLMPEPHPGPGPRAPAEVHAPVALRALWRADVKDEAENPLGPRDALQTVECRSRCSL